jgi:predicted nuclease of predicted toxin-antitoxin system
VRFLLDEGLPFRLAEFLEGEGHDITVCGRDHPQALDDRDILAIALADQRIILTNDKDFGDLVFRERRPHARVIPFRLGYVPIDVRVTYLQQALVDHAHELDQFIVVSLRGSRTGTM